MNKREPDCNLQIYNGDMNISNLELIRNVDDLTIKGEFVLLTALVNDLKHFEGLYIISDVLLGDRTKVQVSGSGFEKNGVMDQKFLGDTMNMYRISKEENPEYFL